MSLGRISLGSLVALFVVFACGDQPVTERVQGVDDTFAAGGPTPEACDTKDLPARDYFASKDDIRAASSLLRDLSDACDSGTVDAYDIGFQLLGMIEEARRIPPPAEAEAVFSAGGLLVEGIWTAMAFTGPACPDCTVDGPTAEQARRSLEPGGAFGVRSIGREAVYSMGDSEAVRWGVEPDGEDWDQVLPDGRALIYGYPGDAPGTLTDATLPGTENGFDVSVNPWYVDPWVGGAYYYLVVGNCAEPTGENAPLISHVAALLPPGPSPSYCSADDPLIALTVGTQVVRLASSLIPFWPQELLAAGGSPSGGRAAAFSPFYGWETSINAATTISQPLDQSTPVGETICFDTDCGPFTFDWTTQGGSDLATRETFRIFTTDNNGATVDFVDGWQAVGGADCSKSGRNEIICTCDGREGTGTCNEIVLEGVSLNKPGVNSLCVESVGDVFGSGLNIAACTENFLIGP